MSPFARLDYDTAELEAQAADLYEAERRRYEDAAEAWDGIRQDINADLERALIDTDTHGF